MEEMDLSELASICESMDKTRDLVEVINKVAGCEVYRIKSLRWDSVVLDITLDPRRDIE